MKRIYGSCLFVASLLALHGIAQAEPAEEVKAAAAPPEGTISSDVLGRRGGMIHPFISSSLSYNDNIRYVADDQVSDLITTLSPGVWASLSRLKERPETIDTSSMIPGGQAMPSGLAEGVRRLHTFAMYRGDFDYYSKYTDENTSQHHLNGAVQYSFPGGLTIGLDDQFAKAHDPRGFDSSTVIDRYTSNLTGVNVGYKLGARLQLTARLSDFSVDYRDELNDYRDRNDRSISLSLPFALTAKTSLYAGYGLTDVTYDSFGFRDSKDHDLFAGVGWKMTGKSTGQFQVGYGKKSFADPTLDAEGYLSLGVHLDHSFSSKSSVRISGYRGTQEASVSTTDYLLTDALSASCSHRFSARWAGSLSATYEQDDYKGGASADRRDTIFSVRPGMRFFWGERLFAELGFSFQERDSSLAEFSYQANSVIISLEYAL
ncbi:MAG: outer membrane beta-barrel protein [Desulfobulbaceae bacterium]|nr:outer membrane beta-barrel protein [Desulfobulbaceae bacterium]